MAFGHEKLDVYRAAINYVGWAYRFEGNGKATDGDRRRYFEIARGSALECGAVQDVLQVCGAITAEENDKNKILLDRIVAMLTKLGQRGYAVQDNAEAYGTDRNDTDTDTDPDPERRA